ncbi:Midasin [Frankliniella fusca]|uniref:Midasin n=1 Tax=Frankliniella fusca TaxID=407009 RepID=A0AAE1GSY3_9NEOP|nr:Midasin [Frankliniella fusca]
MRTRASSPEPKRCPYMGKFSIGGLLQERRARSAGPAGGGGPSWGRASPASPGRWYRRALQEYNPEEDDGGLGEDEEEDDEGTYGTPRDLRRRPAGIDDPHEEARLFNKKKKQQEERDARIKADLEARQEWLKKQQQQQQEEQQGGKQQQQQGSAFAQRRGGGPQRSLHHQLKSHSKRSSGHKAVIEVAHAVHSSAENEDDDEDEDEDDEEDEEVEDEDMDGAIPDPSDLHVDKMPGAVHRLGGGGSGVGSVGSGVGSGGGNGGEGRGPGGRYRPHTPEYGNIDDLLEPSKSSTHWGTYPSDERLLELDSKSSSAGSSSKGGRGRRVRGLGRHHAAHAQGAQAGQGHSRRVRRGFGYEGGLPGLASVDPCERDPGAPGSGGGGGSAGSGRMHLYMGCSTQDTMEFRRDCGAPEPDVVSAYSCHGRWEENGTHFLITTPLPRSSRAVRRYCFVYREQAAAGPGQAAVLHFSSSGESCQRALALASALPAAATSAHRHAAGTGTGPAFNITSSGECMDTSAGARSTPWRSLLSGVSALVILVALR